MNRRNIGIATLVALIAAVVLGLQTGGEAPGPGQEHPQQDRSWDPTGSHPLPNDGVGRGP